MPVPQWASSGIVLILFLFCVVFCRAQATYWLGRGIVSGAVKGREKSKILDGIAKFLKAPSPARAPKSSKLGALRSSPSASSPSGYKLR